MVVAMICGIRGRGFSDDCVYSWIVMCIYILYYIIC